MITAGAGNTNLSNDNAWRSDPKNGKLFPPDWNLNRMHAAAVKVDFSDNPISKCTWVWIQASLNLVGAWCPNNIFVREARWSYPDPIPPANKGIPPDDGFEFRYELDPLTPGNEGTTYTITNVDSARWFRVEDLAFLIPDGGPARTRKPSSNWPAGNLTAIRAARSSSAR